MFQNEFNQSSILESSKGVEFLPQILISNHFIFITRCLMAVIFQTSVSDPDPYQETIDMDQGSVKN